MDVLYTPPAIDKAAFHCPFCAVYAKMEWSYAYFQVPSQHSNAPHKMARCTACGNWSLWGARMNGDHALVYPEQLDAPKASSDLGDPALTIYQEARAVAPHSARAAAALLRLCIETLCQSLGESEKLDSMIGSLVKKGLPQRVQQALDVVRVTGNDAIHPGQINADDEKTTRTLFELVNLIVEYMVTGPKKIEAAFADLPEEKKAAIARRDGAK